MSAFNFLSSSSYNVSITVIEKVSASSNYQEIRVKCTGTDTLQSLRNQIHEALNKPSTEYQIHIAFKGKILNQNESTLQSLNILPDPQRPMPKLFVTMKQLQKSPVIKSRATRQIENAKNESSNTTPPRQSPTQQANNAQHENNNNHNADINEWQFVDRNPEQSQNQNRHQNVNRMPNANDIMDLHYENITGNEEEHKQCRLCFSSEEDNPDLGQLFQPCRCSGTMKWIHVRCLNEWRAVAPNQRSYYQCDQCQYQYNLRRAQWADIVAHEYTVRSISFLILCLGIIVFGITTFKLPFAGYVYDKIEWSPTSYFSHKECGGPWKEACESALNSWWPWAEVPRGCYNGVCYLLPLSEWSKFYIEVFFSGVLVLAVFGLFAIRNLVWRHKWVFLMTLAQNTRVWRLFILLGIGHSFYGLLHTVRFYVKKFLFKWGERILSVDHAQ